LDQAIDNNLVLLMTYKYQRLGTRMYDKL